MSSLNSLAIAPRCPTSHYYGNPSAKWFSNIQHRLSLKSFAYLNRDVPEEFRKILKQDWVKRLVKFLGETTIQEEAHETITKAKYMADLFGIAESTYSKAENYGAISLDAVLAALENQKIGWAHPDLPQILPEMLSFACYASAIGYVRRSFCDKLELRKPLCERPSWEEFVKLLYLFQDDEWFLLKDLALQQEPTAERQQLSNRIRDGLAQQIYVDVQARLGIKAEVPEASAFRIELEALEAEWGDWWVAAISRIPYRWPV